MNNSNTMIGNYRIRTELGHGPSGHVYLAQDTTFAHRSVALKLLDAPSLGPAVEYEQFLQEVYALEILRHPYILHVHNAAIYNGTPFLVSTYAPHGSLRQRLTQNTLYPMPIEESLKIILQVGHALHHAHQQNITHGNLKPENILFNSEGDALLADFGIAVVQRLQTRETALTRTTTTDADALYTYGYMAPEQFKGIVRKESDQYALGCIAYELFTGKRPFSGSDATTLMVQHTTTRPLPPGQLHPELPLFIQQAILKAMAKQPQDRHANSKAFITALCTPTSVPTLQPFVPTPPSSIASPPLAVMEREETVEQLPFPPITDFPALMRGETEPIRKAAVVAPPVTKTTQKSTRHRQWALWALVAISIPLVAIIVSRSFASFAPDLLKDSSTKDTDHPGPFARTATILITPQSKTLKNTYTILGVKSTPDTAQHEVEAHVLSATQAQTQTVPATGKNTTPAVQASAVIALFNNSNRATTLPAGTIFYYTPSHGSNQLEASTDTTVVVPPRTMFVGPGSATVSVHAVTAGAIGNTITSLRCTCRNITVQSPTAFSGGQDAQTTSFVQQSDIDAASIALIPSLTQSILSSLQGQVRTNERIVSNAQCTPTTTSDHKAGDKVTSVNVTISVTCIATVFDQQAALAMAATLLKNDASSHPNATYMLKGTITTIVTSATVSNSIVTVAVQAQSSGIFQFSDAQKHELIALSAGKSKQEAQTLLLQQPGVSQITITSSDSTATMLPPDQRDITINISNV